MTPRWQPRLLILFWGVLMCGVLLATPLPAADTRPAETTRVVEYAGKPVRLRLSVGSATQVEMPEEVVDVVTVLTAQQLGVEYNGAHVHVDAFQRVSLSGRVP